MKAFDKRIRRRLRQALLHLTKEPEAVAVDELQDIRRILLIRTNFRMGNAIMALPVLAAFRERYPQAQIDFLATDSTQAMFHQQPLRHCFVLSRDALLRPWRLVALLRRLRGERYDLAVQIAPGSFSGVVCTTLLRARYTMGFGSSGRRRYHVTLASEGGHAYDKPLAFAHALDVDGHDRPTLRLSASERTAALATLQELGATDASGRAAVPFVALFVGGHLDKRWPADAWRELYRRLEADGIRFLVFLGPEETALESDFANELGRTRCGTLVQPRPVREFAALLAHAALLVTPDSGPMHLGVALDRPTIALLQQSVSRKYAPRGADDRVLWQADAASVHRAIRDRRLPAMPASAPQAPDARVHDRVAVGS